MSDNGRETRALIHYSDELIAEAIAVYFEVGNLRDAARTMAERHPDNSPDFTSIRLWAKRLEPERYNNLQRQRQARIQSRWLDIEEQSLDRIEQDIESGDIKGQTLANMAGISADKRLEEKRIASRAGGGGNTINIVALIEERQAKLTPHDIEVLEGTARTLPDSPHDVDTLEGTAKRPRRQPPKD